MSAKKETAVEWLANWMNKNNGATSEDLYNAFEQAKQLEKEQIIESRITAPMTSGDAMLDREEAEHYFKKTYEKI